MKLHKLLLTADTRGNQTVLYKEIVGHKLLLKKPSIGDKEKKIKPTTFIKKVRLLDITTNSYITQKVFMRVISITNKFLQVEVI